MNEISKLKTYFGADDGAYEDMDKERAKQAWGEREAWRVLQDENARLKAALELAIKHIEGKGESFSEREKTPVLWQLRKALGGGK